MLSTDQKAQIQKGFDIGFSDTHIARVISGVNHMQVYNFRHKLKISSEAIVNKRYDVWRHLIYQGMSISQIAAIYDVTEQSIKVLLWKNRDMSLVEAKAAVLKQMEETARKKRSSSKKGIPDFGEYGL